MIAVFTPVMKVHICCCFHPRRSEGSLFSLLIWLISFCAENVCVTVFFQTLEDIWTLGTSTFRE